MTSASVCSSALFFALLCGSWSLASAIALGSGERAFLRDRLTADCDQETLCAKVNTSSAALETTCGPPCPPGTRFTLSRLACRVCPGVVCDDGLCASDESLCASEVDISLCEACSSRGTLAMRKNGSCECATAYAGETCTECAPDPDPDPDPDEGGVEHATLCCYLDGRWGRSVVPRSRVSKFLSGYYTSGRPCAFQNGTTENGTLLTCDCLGDPDAYWEGAREFGSAMVTRIDGPANQAQMSTPDSSQGAVALFIAIFFAAILLCCCAFVIVIPFVRRMSPTSQQQP